MSIDLSRRSFFRGLGATVIAAPAIVRATSLMPVKKLSPLEIVLREVDLVGSDIDHEYIFRTSIPWPAWRQFHYGDFLQAQTAVLEDLPYAPI
jgi:hypothetical protein